MSKNQNKRPTNVVEEYLVERVKNLEKDITSQNCILEMYKSASELQDLQLKHFETLKGLFELEVNGGVKAIIMRDLQGNYQTIVAVESNDDFSKWIELLELKENK